LLESPGKVKLTASARQKGNKIDISAEVGELEEAGSHIKLRLVLVEDEVGYTGGNQLRKHHHIVRAFPGRVNGTAGKTKAVTPTPPASTWTSCARAWPNISTTTPRPTRRRRSPTPSGRWS